MQRRSWKVCGGVLWLIPVLIAQFLHDSVGCREPTALLGWCVTPRLRLVACGAKSKEMLQFPLHPEANVKMPP